MCPEWVDPVDECPPNALEIVRRATALVEKDLQTTLDPRIECSAFEDERGDVVVRAVWPPTIQQDLWPLPDWDDGVTTTRIIDGLQESDFFDYYYEPWPVCSLHPATTHSMTARPFRGGAWWICPQTGERTAPVGELPAPKRQK